MATKISSRKAKGRSLQQWTCKKISEAIDIPYIPGDDDSLIQSRPMGQSNVDCILRGLAQVRFPFSVECKNQETWNLPKTIEQAKANTKHGTDWLIVLKKNRCEPVVVLDAEVFFKIIRKYAQYHE